MNHSIYPRVSLGLIALGMLNLLPYQLSAQEAAASIEIKKGPHFESSVANRPRVIIFVHGFTGDSTGTWLNDNGAYFPRLVATDPAIKQANVFVASYDTHWTKETATIASLAAGLVEQLNQFRVIEDHKDLVFVCHSLGGLIVERMLIEHPEISSKTAFIQFFGTPHEGAFSEFKSPMFSFLGAFGPNSIIPELRYGSENKALVQLDTEWRNAHLSSIHRFCALESYDFHRSTFVGKVVPYFSGSYGCDSSVPVESILGDHMSMVKPAHRSGDPNQAYLVFLRNYREFPYYETRTLTDSSHDFRLPLQVDCERTKSETNRLVPFDLNPFFKEELIGTPTASLIDADHIKDVSPNPPTVHKLSPRAVEVTYGFNGEDKNLGNCPGGGHATLIVHPTIVSHVPVPDGEAEPASQ
jgi:pimeloyl-ACP methyl ester carboxylesterase